MAVEPPAPAASIPVVARAPSAPDALLLMRQAAADREQGKVENAAAAYLRAGRTFEKQGSAEQALAAYKLAENLSGDRIETLIACAEAYERLALRRDALEQYQQAAELADRSAAGEQAAALRKRIIALDVENVPDRLRLAEHHFDAERVSEGVVVLREVLSILQDQRRYDEYWVVARQVLKHAPEDVSLARLFARVHMRRGEVSQAIDILDRHFAARDGDSQIKSSAALLCAAARKYLEHGRDGHAAQCVRRLMFAGFAALDVRPTTDVFGEETEREPLEPVITPDWKEISLAELIDTSEPTRRAPFVRLIAESVNEINTEQQATNAVLLFEPDLSIHDRSTRQVAPLVVDLVVGELR